MEQCGTGVRVDLRLVLQAGAVIGVIGLEHPGNVERRL